MAKRYGWNKDELYDQYVNQELSSSQIAEIMGCSRSVAWAALKRVDIPMRGYSEAGKLLGFRGENHPSWKGGRWKTRGYIKVYEPSHPYADKAGYVFEHRLVMEKKLGRYLLPDEVAHHLNGIRDDNRPENLEVYPNQVQHFAITRLQVQFKVLEQEVVSLRKDIRLLRWQNKELLQSLQLKLGE